MQFRPSLDVQIRLVLIGEFVVIACLDMTDPYWPLILKQHFTESQRNHLALWSTAIYMAPFLITVITAPVWGYLGQFFGYKKMLIRCTLALAVVQLCIFFAERPVEILILRLLQGAFAGYTAAAQNWLTTKSPNDDSGLLVGNVQAMMATGAIVGPIIGGFISHYFNYESMFLVSSAICFVLSVFCFALLSETPLRTFNKAALDKGTFKASLTSTNLYWYSLIVSTNAMRWMSSSFFALYVVEQLSGNNLKTGVIYGAIALMIFVIAPLWGKVEDKHSQDWHYLMVRFIVVLLVAGCAQVLFGLTHSFIMAIVAAVLWGGALGVINTLPFSFLMKCQKPALQGAVIGFGSSMNKCGNVVGIGLGGVFFCHFGFTETFIAIAIGYGLISLLFFAFRGIITEESLIASK